MPVFMEVAFSTGITLVNEKLVLFSVFDSAWSSL